LGFALPPQVVSPFELVPVSQFEGTEPQFTAPSAPITIGPQLGLSVAKAPEPVPGIIPNPAMPKNTERQDTKKNRDALRDIASPYIK
jgi:hypothetical protein